MEEVGSVRELDVSPGDVVECVRWVGKFYQEGGRYPVVADCGVPGESIGVNSLGGVWRVVSRTSDPPEPKLWRDMTDAEKGALLWAAHKGVGLEYWRRGSGGWVSCSSPGIYDNAAYRIRQEPKVETVTLDGADVRFSGFIKGHRITFNTIDGKPNCESIKMEKL